MDEELRLELLRMFEVDQDLRNRVMKDIGNQKLTAQLVEVDERHTERLRQIIDAQEVWPGKSMVGEDGAMAAWLLTQHADRSPEFQEHCLGLMSSAGEGEVQVKHLAFLTDRVRVNTGRPQVYGTQFWKDESGTFGPRPLEDAETVDERRASVGLGPFEEYRRQMLGLHEEAEKARRDPDASPG